MYIGSETTQLDPRFFLFIYFYTLKDTRRAKKTPQQQEQQKQLGNRVEPHNLMKN